MAFLSIFENIEIFFVSEKQIKHAPSSGDDLRGTFDSVLISGRARSMQRRFCGARPLLRRGAAREPCPFAGDARTGNLPVRLPFCLEAGCAASQSKAVEAFDGSATWRASWAALN